MSECDKVKEEIGFYKTAWSVIVAALMAVTGWFVLYNQQDEKAGLALLSIVVLIGLWLFIQNKIFQLLDKLGEL